MQPDDHAKGAARADLCRFLAACYYEPGPEFTEERLFESMAEAASRVGADFEARARRLGQRFGEATLEDLLRDYTRLFLGPTDTVAKPYGSVWLEPGQGLMQDSTMAVQALYAEGGFELADDFHELPDHIAAELEFLYLMIHRQNDGLRQRFLRQHLGRWIAPFAAAVRSGATEPFYRELAELTERFVEQEAANTGGLS